ncbi:DUF5336 domain-containing protein [Mycobacterium vicinigordonae]|uniref:DUF5336 domain-containing protein n=1 Tax=Mycobacterium vicinigordonae TaxID=1719132 RepID=A0A7D6DZ28_9MYCO|nr:DUF5336 domain-containing protein [Mycobacterium vicinigordonae]QLL06021.1 DUF5336 domain-containing protein [Mycobacterium vicinigordonae]
MAYPSGPSGTSSGGYYGDYSQWAAEPDSAGKDTQRRLTLAVAVLGLASYLVSFGPMLAVGGIDWDVRFAVLAGLLAVFGLLPRQTPASKVIAALAAIGFLDALSRAIVVPDGVEPGWAMWVVVVLNALQTVIAVAALLNQPAEADPQQAWYAAYAEQYAQAAAQYYGQYQQEQHAETRYESGTAHAQQTQQVSASEPGRAAAFQSASYAEFIGDQAPASAPAPGAQTAAPAAGVPSAGHAPSPAQQQTVAFETPYRGSSQ